MISFFRRVCRPRKVGFSLLKGELEQALLQGDAIIVVAGTKSFLFRRKSTVTVTLIADQQDERIWCDCGLRIAELSEAVCRVDDSGQFTSIEIGVRVLATVVEIVRTLSMNYGVSNNNQVDIIWENSKSSTAS